MHRICRSYSTRNDYRSTLGRVMTELPRQLETYFQQGLRPSIYSEEIKFREPRYSGLRLQGQHKYLAASRVLRLAMRGYFKQPALTVVKVRQVPLAHSASKREDPLAGWEGPHHRQQAETQERFEILVRWVFEGRPRHREWVGNSEGARYEGEFRYAVDSRGLLSLHEVVAIHPTPPTSLFASTTYGLARWAACWPAT